MRPDSDKHGSNPLRSPQIRGYLDSLNFVINQRFPGYQRMRRNSYFPSTFLPAKTKIRSLGDTTSNSTSPSSQGQTRPMPKASSSKFLLSIESAEKLSLSIASLLSPPLHGGSFKRDQERKIPFWMILKSKWVRPVLCWCTTNLDGIRCLGACS